jgi:hypothetical protein
MMIPPVLLADPSACLRWQVLRYLLHMPEEHPEVQEVSALRLQDALLSELLGLQEADGSWKAGPFAYGAASSVPVLTTAFVLARLGFLGFDGSHPAVSKAAEFLFAQQQPDGSWPLQTAYQDEELDEPRIDREGYAMQPLQTALPLRGLVYCGYATDPRAERAFDWLLAQRLSDGAWPTGLARSGVYGYVAGYRRLAHSRWGCRSNTTGALVCLSLHPQRRHSPEAYRALDLLLGRETRELHAMGSEVSRLLGAEPIHGFITYFARYDLALILELCARIGATQEDERVAELADFILQRRGPYGLWEYTQRPQVSRWLTLNLIRSLAALEPEGKWQSQEPRTPFQAYPKRKKRF